METSENFLKKKKIGQYFEVLKIILCMYAMMDVKVELWIYVTIYKKNQEMWPRQWKENKAKIRRNYFSISVAILFEVRMNYLLIKYTMWGK